MFKEESTGNPMGFYRLPVDVSCRKHRCSLKPIPETVEDCETVEDGVEAEEDRRLGCWAVFGALFEGSSFGMVWWSGGLWQATPFWSVDSSGHMGVY